MNLEHISDVSQKVLRDIIAVKRQINKNSCGFIIFWSPDRKLGFLILSPRMLLYDMIPMSASCWWLRTVLYQTTALHHAKLYLNCVKETHKQAQLCVIKCWNTARNFKVSVCSFQQANCAVVTLTLDQTAGAVEGCHHGSSVLSLLALDRRMSFPAPSGCDCEYFSSPSDSPDTPGCQPDSFSYRRLVVQTHIKWQW